MDLDMPRTNTFQNEPYIDFTVPSARDQLAETVAGVSASLGKTSPLIINGERRFEGELETIRNPANTDEIIGKVHLAAPAHTGEAIHAAQAAFQSWRFVPYHQRSSLLLQAAQLARKRKLELSVLLSKENGKSIREAVADVAEGIDFLDYYARRMNEIGSGDTSGVISLPGERNQLLHLPLGAGSIIAPWNFPFAILIGMTAAAIVAGNTVILKPSTNTPVIAYKAVELLEEAGSPPGVVNFLPCRGSRMGDLLVEDPRIRFIAFTGSTAVGKSIYEKAARFVPGQTWFKRMILETGGKNHILVCDDARLDAAVSGVARAAFGYSGQKCSACAVVLVQEGIYERFVPALVAYSEKLKLGQGSDPDAYTGPVISADAAQKIIQYIKLGKKEGTLLLGGQHLGKVAGKAGYYIEPTIFADLPSSSRLHKEEIFGPVLAIRKIKNPEEAFEIAGQSGYGLTGGVFTQSDAIKARAIERFHVGNLYINKSSGGSTGAMVGRQPFGGFNLSGTDSKAGGPNYLYLFMQEKAIADMGS